MKYIYLLLLGLACTTSPSRLIAQHDTTFYNVSAISSTVPNAFAMGHLGTVGFGGNLLSTTRLSDKTWDPDANGVLSVGLGNPEKYIGIDLRVNVYGISDSYGEKSNLGEGTIDLHLNRKLNNCLWLAVGGYDLFGWHTSEINRLQSYYTSLTGVLSLKESHTGAFSTLWLTMGVGNGRFRTNKNYDLPKSGKLNVFASAAIQILPRANFIAEWSGYGIYTGISFVPLKKLPFQMIIGGDDLSNNQRRVVLGAAFGFNLKKKNIDGTSNQPFYLPVPPPPQSSRL
jgi:hypothetical protein